MWEKTCVSLLIAIWCCCGVMGNKDKTSKISKHPTGPFCLHQCTSMYFNDLSRTLGSDVMNELRTLSIDKILHVFSNTTNFKLFCKIYTKNTECLEACPASFFREILRQGMRIIDFHCVERYKEIIKYFPCFGKIKSNQSCIESCSTKQEALFELSKQFKHLALAGDSSQAERLLNESCEYMQCNMDCDIPQIRAICGQHLVKLLQELVINSFDIIHDIALGTGAIEIWPQKCNLLQKYQPPPPIKPTIEDNRTPGKEINAIEGDSMSENGKMEEKQKSSGAEPVGGSFLISICLSFLFIGIVNRNS